MLATKNPGKKSLHKAVRLWKGAWICKVHNVGLRDIKYYSIWCGRYFHQQLSKLSAVGQLGWPAEAGLCGGRKRPQVQYFFFFFFTDLFLAIGSISHTLSKPDKTQFKPNVEAGFFSRDSLKVREFFGTDLRYYSTLLMAIFDFIQKTYPQGQYKFRGKQSKWKYIILIWIFLRFYCDNMQKIFPY